MGPGESGISPAFHLSLSKLRDLHLWYRSAAEKEQAAAMLTLMRNDVRMAVLGPAAGQTPFARL
jgi:hypothetical protein